MPPVTITSVMPVATSSVSGAWLASARAVVHDAKCTRRQAKDDDQRDEDEREPDPVEPGDDPPIQWRVSAVTRSTGVSRSAIAAPGLRIRSSAYSMPKTAS